MAVDGVAEHADGGSRMAKSSARPIAVVIVACLLALGSPLAADAQGSGRIISAPQRYLDVVFDAVTPTPDVQYNESRNNAGVMEAHYADVYRPTGDTETRRPLVIWIHGGGFSGGNRGQMTNFATDSAKRGFVSASISYRIRPGFNIYTASAGQQLGTIHDATRDAQGAVRFFREHAAEYGIDPDRIMVGGYSAGAVISLWLVRGEHLTLSTHPENQFWDDHSSAVQAASVLAGGWGGVVETGDAPIVMFHGDDDTTVPYANGVQDCEAHLAAGSICEFHTYDTTHLLSPWYPEIRTLSAEFFYRQITCGLAFEDVGVAHPFCADIDWMATNGVAGGFDDGTYRPTAVVSRQVAVSFLHALVGAPGCSPDPGFPDVPSGHLFGDPIAWGVEFGVVNGYTDGLFRPTAPVTRQAFVAYLYRLGGGADDPPTATPTAFADVPGDHLFHDEIVWAADQGIVSGYDDGTFRPLDPVTRQAAAAFVHRANDEDRFLIVGSCPFE